MMAANNQSYNHQSYNQPQEQASYAPYGPPQTSYDQSYQGQGEPAKYEIQGQIQGGQRGQSFMVHPGLGKVQGPNNGGEQDNGKEMVPYPVYVRPYDDELPQVTWKKNPAEPFGTLTIVKGEDKMIVKVPMKNDRLLPRTNYPIEVGSVIFFAVIAALMWLYL